MPKIGHEVNVEYCEDFIKLGDRCAGVCYIVFFSCILSACLTYFIIKQTSNDNIIHRIQNVSTLRLLLQEQSWCVMQLYKAV